MTDLRTQLADLIAELINPYEHAQEYTLRPAIPDTGRETQTIRVHRVRFPPLIVQLAMAVEPSTSTEAGARGYESSPTARIDAIDRLNAIRAATGLLLYDAGVKPTGHLGRDIRAIVGATMDDQLLRIAVKEARTWLTWARIVTGWDTPPVRPHVRCPICDHLGGIRVRFDPTNACCVECGTAWDESTVGLLAAEIVTAGEEVSA